MAISSHIGCLCGKKAHPCGCPGTSRLNLTPFTFVLEFLVYCSFLSS